MIEKDEVREFRTQLLARIHESPMLNGQATRDVMDIVRDTPMPDEPDTEPGDEP